MEMSPVSHILLQRANHCPNLHIRYLPKEERKTHLSQTEFTLLTGSQMLTKMHTSSSTEAFHDLSHYTTSPFSSEGAQGSTAASTPTVYIKMLQAYNRC